jgi:hypothetical protein
MIRRITTGFVRIACAITSDVTAPSCCAMCSSTCRTPESRLSRLTQLYMLRDDPSVKTRPRVESATRLILHIQSFA